MAHVLVTGGARGIGAAVCRRAAALGWAVTVNYRRDAEAAEATADAVRAAGARAFVVAGDVASEDDTVAMFDRAVAALGPVTGVVANAGIVAPEMGLAEMDAARLRRVVDVNVVGALLTDFLRRNPAGKVPVLRMDGRMMAESAAICEYIEDRHPEPPLMPRAPEARYEVRRLVSWFDDKFHHEVTSKLLYERVNKKVMGQGYPDSGNVKAGAKAIKFHIDYIGWLLDQRRWLAGDAMTLADFAAAAHLSALDYISDVDWNRNANVKDWYAKIKSRPAFRSLLADHVPGFPAPPHYSDLDF
jgi:glutathione S-transferase